MFVVAKNLESDLPKGEARSAEYHENCDGL